ncbi:hypothetical protein SO694_0004209 [Aureococcus anophagefferens]|uniref:Uncharacterized protein n=1 Tax=Aureococcus anophagefferens TaxID=44056 RepID=A0ABR1G6A1_AURAN
MAASTAPAASATASSTDESTAARHLWHVAIATRAGDDGEDELYAAEATTKGTVLLTIAKTDATMLPIHRGDTVQVGAHEHCVLGAAGALLVADPAPAGAYGRAGRRRRDSVGRRRRRRPGRRRAPEGRPARDGVAALRRLRGARARAPARRGRRGRDAEPAADSASGAHAPAVVGACATHPAYGAPTGDGDQSELDRDRYAALEEVWNAGRLLRDFFAGRTRERNSKLQKPHISAVFHSRRSTPSSLGSARPADCDFEGAAAALADAGALVDARDLLGRTPLFCLVATSYDPGSDKKAKALALLDVLRNAARTNAEDRAGMVPLFGPAKENKVDIVTALLQRGADAHRPFRFFRQSTMEAPPARSRRLKFDERVCALLKDGKASWKTHKRYCVPAGKKKAPPAGSASVAAAPAAAPRAAPATAAPAAESPAAVATTRRRLARELDAESAPSDKAGFETFAAKTEAFLAKYG